MRYCIMARLRIPWFNVVDVLRRKYADLKMVAMTPVGMNFVVTRRRLMRYVSYEKADSSLLLRRVDVDISIAV